MIIKIFKKAYKNILLIKIRIKFKSFIKIFFLKKHFIQKKYYTYIYLYLNILILDDFIVKIEDIK